MDCGGLLAAPGLIDPHMHVDTTFLWPGELARILVPLGTTTVVVGTINIAHTGGTRAVNSLREAFTGLPLRGIFSAPSYCPFNPALETAAANMTTDEIIALLDDGCVSIGETVWSRVALEDTEYLRLIHACRERGLRVSGHGGEVPRGNETAFDAYVMSGMHDDHCLAQGMDLLPRLRRGLELFLVEASGRRDQLARLLSGARDLKIDEAVFTARSPEGDGGFVVVDNGQVLARVALPVDGIMAVAPYETVVADLDRAQAVARELGCTLEHPLFTLAQTVLSTLPELGLTDKGLVNAREGRIIPAEMNNQIRPLQPQTRAETLAEVATALRTGTAVRLSARGPETGTLLATLKRQELPLTHIWLHPGSGADALVSSLQQALQEGCTPAELYRMAAFTPAVQFCMEH